MMQVMKSLEQNRIAPSVPSGFAMDGVDSAAYAAIAMCIMLAALGMIQGLLQFRSVARREIPRFLTNSPLSARRIHTLEESLLFRRSDEKDGLRTGQRRFSLPAASKSSVQAPIFRTARIYSDSANILNCRFVAESSGNSFS